MKLVLIMSFAVMSAISNSYQNPGNLNGILETEDKKVNEIKKTIMNKINDEIQGNKCKNCIVKSQNGSRQKPGHGRLELEKVDKETKMETLKKRCAKKRKSKACMKHLGPAASLRHMPAKKRDKNSPIPLPEGSCWPNNERTFINGTGHICCNGTQFRAPELPYTDCCGIHPFDTRTHVCCAGLVQEARGNSNVKGKCCGQVNFYRNCYKCKRPENVLQFKYDVKQKECCAGRLLKIGGPNSCCNDTIYNQREYVCILGIVHRANFSLYSETIAEPEEHRAETNRSDMLPVANKTGNDIVVAMLPAPNSERDHEGSTLEYIYVAIGVGGGVLTALSIFGVIKIVKICKAKTRRRSFKYLTDTHSSYSNPGAMQDSSEINNAERAGLIDHTRGGISDAVVQRRADVACALLSDQSFDGASGTDGNCNVTNSVYGQGSICSSHVVDSEHRSQANSMPTMFDTAAKNENHVTNVILHTYNNQTSRYSNKDFPPTENTAVAIQGNLDFSCDRKHCGASESNLCFCQSRPNEDEQISKKLSTSTISIKMEPEAMEVGVPDENDIQFNSDYRNTEESENFLSLEMRLHLRHNDDSNNQFSLSEDKRNERKTSSMESNSLPETITKSSTISEKNLTTSLFSDCETQTSPEKSMNKRNIFCRDWDFHSQFGERGGTLQQDKDSSVQLIIQPNSIKNNTFIDVHGSTYTQIPEMRRKLSIPEDEEFASVGVEYMIPGHPELAVYAVVKMKYTGQAADLKVYWFRSDEGSSDKTETKLVEAQNKENNTNQEMFYVVGEDGFVYVYTKHFSGFVCAKCAKVTHALYPYVFGSCKKSKKGLCQVALRMHVMTSDVYSLPEYFKELVVIERKSSREYRERHEIILTTTDEPRSQLKFRLEVDNEDEWIFKYHPQETTREVGDVVRCHTDSNARIDWFLESKHTASAYDLDSFGCCIKINEELPQLAACDRSCIVIPAMEPEPCNTVMMKDPLDKRSYAQPVQVSQQLPTAQNDSNQAQLACSKFEADRPVLADDRAHAELACTRVNFAAGNPMLPGEMDSSFCGPPANIAVKFPVQEKGDVLKTNGSE